MSRINKISIIIPALNEEKSIEKVIDAIREKMPSAEIIVVDDGSSDKTAEKAYNKGVKVIKHMYNLGYGAALKTGIKNANGEIVAFLDADGTYPPIVIPDMVRKLNEGYDLVVGNRLKFKGNFIANSIIRKIGNEIFAFVISFYSKKNVGDCGSGLRVFKKEKLEKIIPCLPDGLNFTPAMTIHCLFNNIKYLEIPIPYFKRVGKSKLKVLRDGIRFIITIYREIDVYKPFNVLGKLGFILLLFGELCGIWLLNDLIRRMLTR